MDEFVVEKSDIQSEERDQTGRGGLKREQTTNGYNNNYVGTNCTLHCSAVMGRMSACL